MNAQAASVRRTGETPALGTPQLRTLLLTDLVDSTALVERLGDGAAAALFRDHDALVLELQQRWRGRLIDRSDGLLLLFERPIDGLGFALDYERGLRTLGPAHGVVLQARAGLHVGEVLTWRNSDAAVAVGAKPLEVEGLAKPMAGRLMTLARPGQLLLSAVAEPLARRAARELGERGEHLLWKSWGRWRFKGVPEAQELYEVGEPGLAPLRAPKPTAKAWRDIPLWRRPAALAAEVLVLAGLATGAWFATRPQPAIAFGERDWVVVADLRNLTSDKVLDDSLEQAFRISLEQSRYVNVLSDLKARDTLALMQRQPGTALDRTVASEIALRDGARAVILPTVSEVGGKVRVSAEVIDPHTQTTVYAESADGTGAASTLGSIDHVTAALRGKLGEALESIEKTSAPLPQVSTGNLDALRAYALGQRAYERNDYEQALTLYRQATTFDQEFALAWAASARASYALDKAVDAQSYLRRALLLRRRLAPRESLYVDGWAAELETPSAALGKWQLLARLYPDFLAAQANAAIRLFAENRFDEALVYASKAGVPQFDLPGLAYDQIGRSKLAIENGRGAREAFNQAVAAGRHNSYRRLADVAAVARNWPSAEAALAHLKSNDLDAFIERVSISVDRGEWQEARNVASKALSEADSAAGQYPRSFQLQQAITDGLAGASETAIKRARETAAAALKAAKDEPSVQASDDLMLAISAALVSQRFGDRTLAHTVIVAQRSFPGVMKVPELQQQLAVLEAQTARLDDHPKEALAKLAPYGGRERLQTKVELMESFAAAGDYQSAIKKAREIRSRRGLAYIELGCTQCLQALNVADTNLAALREAELLRAQGNVAEAQKILAAFDAAWPIATLPPYLRSRREAVVAASKAGGF